MPERPNRHRGRRLRVAILAALGALLVLALVAGEAQGSSLGYTPQWAITHWELDSGGINHVAGIWNSPASLQEVDFQVNAGSPTAYAFGSIRLTVNRRSIPNNCAPRTAVTVPTISCTFNPTAVESSDTLVLSFKTTPQLPLNNGGSVFVKDFAGATSNTAVPGPTPAPVTEPYVRNASLGWLLDRRPQLKFTLHQGMNAPKLKKFTLEFPRGLSLAMLGHQFLNFGRWDCRRRGKEELSCGAKAPQTAAIATIKWPVLAESSRFRGSFKHHKHLPIPFHLRIYDAKGTVSSLTMKIRATD